MTGEAPPGETPAAGAPPLVHIHYLRPPDRERIYSQYLISDEEQVKVTLAQDLTF